jgi:cellobiose-specific phosphotransferase system component IIA
MTKPEVVKVEEMTESPIESIYEEPREIDLEIRTEDIEGMVPQMNVSVPDQPKNEPMLITDDQYLGLLDEILSSIREDRKQVSGYIDNFADMVMNDGDATTSTKEALVNLVKVKTDLQDKMLKTADLMTRLKMKNTYAYSGPHLNAMQQNNFNIGADADFGRKELIKAINQAKKKKKEQ